ncbi:MAG: M14 family metallopeptidase [Leptospira sp.]|nr:M14 family metallopeptidase [Leptospira sp.]
MTHFESYFKSSYSEAQAEFLERCKKLKEKFPFSKEYSIHLEAIDRDIPIFVLKKTEKQSTKLILVSSGVHGVEGYYGSAMQSLVMDEYLSGKISVQSDTMFIHAINPFGFENGRRVNENNIDLNRNFFFKREKIHKKEKNKGYKKLSSFFMPKFPFTFWGIEYLIFSLRFGGILFRYGVRKFTDALVNGQFQYKKGIYYGGKKPEPVVKKLKNFFLTHIADYSKIILFDLHTGHGEKNKLVLIQNSLPGSLEDQNIASIVSGLPLLRPDSSTSFYRTAGDFTDYLERIFPGHNGLFPLTVEMGTLGNLDFWGALRGTFLMIAENRIYHRGSWFQSSRNKVNQKFLQYFYPKDRQWMRSAYLRTKVTIKTLIQRFENLN